MFDKNKVKDVAKLAMIEIDEKDLEFFSQEIIDFLKLVEQTESLELNKIEPLYHAPENTLHAREDIVDENPSFFGFSSTISSLAWSVFSGAWYKGSIS